MVLSWEKTVWRAHSSSLLCTYGGALIDIRLIQRNLCLFILDLRNLCFADLRGLIVEINLAEMLTAYYTTIESILSKDAVVWNSDRQ